MIDKPSRTAADVAMLRAMCCIAPMRQRIMQDEMSLAMIPPPWAAVSRPLLALPLTRPLAYRISRRVGHYLAGAEGMHELIALRFRYIEERLKLAYDAGFRQVVLLGAGYDYRPYRPDFEEAYFLEIDHPYTQKAKRELLARYQVRSKNEVQYLPVDFMGDWSKAVADSGLLRPEPSFVIWEGVPYYLNQAAVEYTFRSLAGLLQPGSRVVFDCLPDLNRCDQALGCRHIQQIGKYVAGKGEPFLWGTSVDEIGDLLARFGFNLTALEKFDAVLQRYAKQDRLDIEPAPILRHFFLVEAELGRAG